MAEICPTSMTVPRLSTMSFAPTSSTNTMLKFMQRVISGVLSATMRSAFVKSLRMSPEAAANFCFSKPSREKLLTTRIPRTFSSMDSFIRSYLRKTARKAGIACRAMVISPTASTGTTTMKVVASAPPM